MNFAWKNYLFLAAELKSQADAYTSPEAALRSAVSRAYYAAFNCSQDFIRKRGDEVSPHGSSSHERLQEYFTQRKDEDPAYGQISVNFDRLRKLRTEADYKPQFSTCTLEGAATQAVDFATVILRCLDQLNVTG
jgi:uncharacterized protein (UPF0332 family)